MKKINVLWAGLAVFFLLVVPASATEFVTPDDKESGRVVLGSQQEYKNVYTAGSSVQINSEVKGDIFAAGSDISMDGTVEQDAFFAGGTVSIQNKINGDARVAGGTVNIKNEVAGDVLAAGGQVVISEKAKVGGDLAVAGGQVSVEGPVLGKAWITGGNIYINSEIVGALKIKNADKVSFGPNAKVLGRAEVSAKTEPVLSEGASVADLQFSFKSGAKKDAGFLAGILAFAVAVSFLGYIVIGLLVMWISPKKAENFLASMKVGFWANLGIGFAGLIIIPIVSVLAMVVLVGVYAGLTLLALYLSLVALSWIMALVFAGSYGYMLMARGRSLVVSWQTVVVGAIIFTILRFIPVVGALVIFVLMFTALGQWLVSMKRLVVERGARVAE